MSHRFWFGRFLTVLVVAFFLIAGAHLLRGRSGRHAVSEGLVWSLITAVLFTSTRWYGSRRGQPCALCGDIKDATGK